MGMPSGRDATCRAAPKLLATSTGVLGRNGQRTARQIDAARRTLCLRRHGAALLDAASWGRTACQFRRQFASSANLLLAVSEHVNCQRRSGNPVRQSGLTWLMWRMWPKTRTANRSTPRGARPPARSGLTTLTPCGATLRSRVMRKMGRVGDRVTSRAPGLPSGGAPSCRGLRRPASGAAAVPPLAAGNDSRANRQCSVPGVYALALILHNWPFAPKSPGGSSRGPGPVGAVICVTKPH
jgi:hypothetical protein